MLFKHVLLCAIAISVSLSYFRIIQANTTVNCATRGNKSAFTVKRELRILSRLSHYVKDKQEATQLVDVLLPFLKAKKRMDLG